MSNSQKIKERIKMLFVWRDVTFTAFADYMNKKSNNTKKYSQSSLSHKLSRGTILFDEVLEICDNLGYDVIFKPRTDWEPWEK